MNNMTSRPMGLYIPEGADKPAPDNTMIFLDDSRTFLNSVISEEGAIDFRFPPFHQFSSKLNEKRVDLLRSIAGSSSEAMMVDSFRKFLFDLCRYDTHHVI